MSEPDFRADYLRRTEKALNGEMLQLSDSERLVLEHGRAYLQREPPPDVTSGMFSELERIVRRAFVRFRRGGGR